MMLNRAEFRPYKVITIAPVMFSSVAVLLVLRGLVSAPWQALFAVIFTMAGLALYYAALVDWRKLPLFGLNILERPNISVFGLPP
jgi:hypothetical protein